MPIAPAKNTHYSLGGLKHHTGLLCFWYNMPMKDIQELESKLSTPLATDQQMLIEQLSSVQAMQLDLEKAMVDADYDLNLKKAQYLMPVIKGQTEMDRKISLARSVAEEQRIFDTLQAYSNTLNTKLQLGQSMLVTNSSHQHTSSQT